MQLDTLSVRLFPAKTVQLSSKGRDKKMQSVVRARHRGRFHGGPVAQDGMMMMLRAETEPEGAEHIFADVYVNPSRDVLDRLVAKGADNFRSYVGYAGWAPGQLDHELERQDWHVTPGDADLVFSPAPESVWDKLIKQTDVLFAGGAGPRFPPRGEAGKREHTGLHGLFDKARPFFLPHAGQPSAQAALENRLERLFAQLWRRARPPVCLLQLKAWTA